MSETAEQEWDRLSQEWDEADAWRCPICGTPGKTCEPCKMTEANREGA